jgi:hypothetical protein
MMGSTMIGRLRGRFWTYALCAGLWLAAPGCSGSGDDLPRQPVAGTVLLDGRPLASGTILFLLPPSGAQPFVSTPNSISNGRFSLTRENGLVPGKYKIVISADQRGANRRDPRDAKTLSKEMIPAKFNDKTELEVKVNEGGIKELRIAITSK